MALHKSKAGRSIHPATIPGSSRHFKNARDRLAEAKETYDPSEILYAAIELRYGIEYLLFECLVLTGFLTDALYEECIGDQARMDKMLGQKEAKYEKLCDFYEAVGRVTQLPESKRWNIRRLFKSWGIASSYLHFSGSHRDSHEKPEWLAKAIADLESALSEIWIAITTKPGSGLMRPSGMKPPVRAIWEDFAEGKIDLESVEARLRLLPL